MIFKSERRAEYRHETIAEKLINRAFEAVHLGQCQREEFGQQIVHRLRPKLTRQHGRIDHVAEQHRDLLLLAAQTVAIGKDARGQIARRIAGWRAPQFGAARRPIRARLRVTAIRAEALRRLHRLRANRAVCRTGRRSERQSGL